MHDISTTISLPEVLDEPNARERHITDDNEGTNTSANARLVNFSH
jgi:hypothetical protein